MTRTAYTHDSTVLAQLSRLVTINSAMEVDLTGQVNAEQSGDMYLAARRAARIRAGGGALARGAFDHRFARHRQGRTISKIVTALSGPVTTARSEVDIIVTEFGAAQLRGQPLAERAKRMIAIAHPDFREDLARAAHGIEQRGF